MMVRTFTGAWIETSAGDTDDKRFRVRTFTGAWIETFCSASAIGSVGVRTFTGAWIETKYYIGNVLGW